MTSQFNPKSLAIPPTQPGAILASLNRPQRPKHKLHLLIHLVIVCHHRRDILTRHLLLHRLLILIPLVIKTLYQRHDNGLDAHFVEVIGLHILAHHPNLHLTVKREREMGTNLPMRRTQRLHYNWMQLLITPRPALEVIATKNRQLIEVQARTPNRTLRVVHATGEREQAPDTAIIGVQGLGQEREVGFDGGEFGDGVCEGSVGGCRSQRGEGGEEDCEEAFREHFDGMFCCWVVSEAWLRS